VSFTGNPVSETLDAIRAGGGKEMKSKQVNAYYIQSPTSDLLRLLQNGGAIKTTPALSGSVNLICFPTLSLIRRIFSNFLYTHQYPAFKDRNHLQYNIEHWLVETGNPLKRKGSEFGDAGPSKRTRLDDGEPADPDTVMEEDSGIETGATSRDTIVHAIPPPKIDIAWGAPSDLPAGDGLFVRYLADTQNGQGERIVPRVINRYFLGCLGNNAESVQTMFKRLKDDWGVICQTDAGKELAHLAMCIHLGIQSQARIWPVIDNEQYLGCCLMGAGFRFAAYDQVYTPVDNETLRERIGLATSHRTSLENIARIVTGDDSSDEQWAQVMNVSSMVELRELLLETNVTSVEREQICAFARGLRFKTRPFHISAENISLILTLIAKPEQPIDHSVPIHPLYLFSGNRTHLLWSAFGDMAPTFQFLGGPQYDLTRIRDLPSHIAVRNVALSDALLDLDVILRSKKYSGATNNRRSGMFKDRVYTKVDARQILTSLCSAAGVSQSQTTSGKERAVEGVAAGILDDGF